MGPGPATCRQTPDVRRTSLDTCFGTSRRPRMREGPQSLRALSSLLVGFELAVGRLWSVSWSVSNVSTWLKFHIAFRK